MDTMPNILASFGVITDLHYADHDDGTDFTGTFKRYFRDSLVHLENAVCHWNNIPTMKFAVQIGDIIDGRNNRKDNESRRAIERVLAICDLLKTQQNGPLPFLHVVGNHDLYNFNRNLYQESILNSSERATNLDGFKTCDDKRNYYSYIVCKHYRIVVLDNYDISVLGIEDLNDTSYLKALEFMKKNLNDDYNSSIGLIGLDKRFTAYNGAFGKQQLTWLENIIKESEKSSENLIIFGHTPIHPQSTVDKCLAWNYDEILKIMQSTKAIMVYICGHDHQGGFVTDESGIVHITLEGTVEKKLCEGNSYLTIDLSIENATITHNQNKIIINTRI